VAGHGVDRLTVAAVPLGGARVEQHAIAGEAGGSRGVNHGHATRPGSEIALIDGRGGSGEREPGRRPGCQAAIQDADVAMAEIAQQPPGARRTEAAAGVVDDHRRFHIDTAAAHGRLEDAGVRQGMATVPAPR